jgi:hypothetical protein
VQLSERRVGGEHGRLDVRERREARRVVERSRLSRWRPGAGFRLLVLRVRKSRRGWCYIGL